MHHETSAPHSGMAEKSFRVKSIFTDAFCVGCSVSQILSYTTCAVGRSPA